MQPWEYRVIHRVRPARGGAAGEWDTSVVAELPRLGEEGWELVTVVTRSSEGGAASAGVTTDEMWVFKRPKTMLQAETTVIVAQAEVDEPVTAAEEVVAPAAASSS